MCPNHGRETKRATSRDRLVHRIFASSSCVGYRKECPIVEGRGLPEDDRKPAWAVSDILAKM